LQDAVHVLGADVFGIDGAVDHERPLLSVAVSSITAMPSGMVVFW